MAVSYHPTTGLALGIEKSLLEIYISLNALTNGQKSTIWADFTSGNPPK